MLLFLYNKLWNKYFSISDQNITHTYTPYFIIDDQNITSNFPSARYICFSSLDIIPFPIL